MGTPPGQPGEGHRGNLCGRDTRASTSPRSSWLLTRWLAAEASAGKVTVVTARTRTTRREASGADLAPARRAILGGIAGGGLCKYGLQRYLPR